MNKRDIRREISIKKNLISFEEKVSLSDKIFSQIEKLSLFNSSKVILIYHSLSDEVFTHDVIERWSKNKTIILPKVVADGIMELRCYNSKDDMSLGAYGILEPCGELFNDYLSIDLAIIPGVAFDLFGNRLGRGKGYYDRILPKIKCQKIGVCFQCQLLEQIPSEPHDVKMDMVVYS